MFIPIHHPEGVGHWTLSFLVVALRYVFYFDLRGANVNPEYQRLLAARLKLDLGEGKIEWGKVQVSPQVLWRTPLHQRRNVAAPPRDRYGTRSE